MHHLGEQDQMRSLSREAIYNEVKEVNERDKRKCSVILRRFNCNSVGAVRANFGEICQAFEVGFVELSDVKKVGNRALFHAKILDDEKRRELLMVKKN